MAVALPTEAIQTNFGDIVQRGVANVQAAEELAYQRQEQERKKALEFEDRYGIPEELFQLEDTEFRTVNDATTEALSLARDRYYDVYKELEKDPTNIDLKKRLGKIKNFVSTMGASHQKFMELGQNYLKMIQEDKISGVDEDEWKERLEAADEGRIRVTMDDNDNLQFLFYDKNGALKDVMKYTELIRGQLIEKVDLDNEINELTKSLGGFVKDERTGGYIRTTDLFGTKQIQGVNDWVSAQFEDDARTADLLYQASGGQIKKRKDFTEADKELIREFVQRQVRSRYDEKESLKADQTYLTRQRMAESRNARKEKEGTPDIEANTANGRPQLDERGRVVFSLTKPFAVDPAKSDTRIQTIKASPDGIIRLEGQERQKVKEVPDGVTPENASSYGYFSDTSNGAVTYYKLEPYVLEYNPAVSLSDNMSEEERASVNKTRAMVNAFATRMGYKDEDDLRNALYESFVDKFGVEVADEMFSPERKQEAVRQRVQQALSARNSSEKIENMINLSDEEWSQIDPKSLQGEDKKAYYQALVKRNKS